MPLKHGKSLLQPIVNSLIITAVSQGDEKDCIYERP